MRPKLRWLRHIVINYLTRHLLKAVTEEDILIISGKDWLHKNRRLSREEVLQLKEEAVSFESSLLYKLMYADLRFMASKQMTDNAQVVDDIVFGKAMLYNAAMEKKFVKNLTKL